MPLAPQITNTPSDIAVLDFAISAVSHTSSTATYTATGHTFASGDTVIVSGLAPDGYNGTFTITSIATNTFTVANSTNATVTDAVGNAYSVNNTDYDLSDTDVVYKTSNEDVTDIIAIDATVSAAYAAAVQAQSDAAAAQSTATSALSTAGTAYTAAVGSLQPSASTIVNSSNQMTAIASNGITVYSGSSSSSGARVVMNSVGLAGYDASNNATFSITASTGAAVFSGSVTGSTITGGTLNIAGKAVIDSSGLLTATGATITGTINATSGYFGTSSDGFSISSTGMVGVGNGVISGGTVSGAVLIVGTSSTSDFMHTSYARNTPTLGYSVTGFGINAIAMISSSTAGVYSHWYPYYDNDSSLGLSSYRWVRVYAVNSTISTSDQRLKKNIAISDLGLDFVNSLAPKKFNKIYKTAIPFFDENNNPTVDENGNRTIDTYRVRDGERYHYGFLAQEVKSSLDQFGVGDNFAGWTLDDPNDPDSRQGLAYEEFIAPLVKAVQELTDRVKQLEGK